MDLKRDLYQGLAGLAGAKQVYLKLNDQLRPDKVGLTVVKKSLLGSGSASALGD